MTKALKKLQHVLWGLQFELLVDAASLARMLSSPTLSNETMGRCVLFIHLFALKVVHVPGKCFSLPDALSRIPGAEESRLPEGDWDEDERAIKVDNKVSFSKYALARGVVARSLPCATVVSRTVSVSPVTGD